jgi:hypothetical protein
MVLVNTNLKKSGTLLARTFGGKNNQKNQVKIAHIDNETLLQELFGDEDIDQQGDTTN